jgi:3-phenylpropionate/trans-cinnamate dioxygenase ferredoxin reductase component
VSQTFVIVGANLAGGAAATTLRTEGFEGRVVLIGAESHAPYERPPLSKEYLRGEGTRESAMLHPASWYEDNGIETLLGVRATSLDTGRRLVHLEGREAVQYDSVLLATGGRNRRLDAPGRDLDGIHELRTFEDADRIRSEATAGASRKAVIVGAGFIGCEVAASLRHLGVDVEIVEFLEAPLVRVVGLEIGRVYEAIHSDHGVRLRFGEGVERFEGTDRVEAVVTSGGARIDCDFVVVGVGILPATDVVEGADVGLENGIVVDERCRTDVAGVFAAGDVANHYHPIFGHRLRVEHWDNALKQGAAAAKSMLGMDVTYDDPHWFWSDQYEHNLQYAGFAAEWDDLVVRGSLDERNFVAFFVKDGVVRAAAGLNRGRDVRRAAGIIRAARPVDPALLRDEDVDLKKLAASSAAGIDGGEH